MRELIIASESDLGGGEQLTEGKRQLVQRAAVLGALIEDYETRWLAGEPFEMAGIRGGHQRAAPGACDARARAPRV